MTAVESGDDGAVSSVPGGPSLVVREPVQQRSRERWAKVLDCGVELLEEGGYDALTIAAVCERAGVPPRAIYERVDSKDALLIAVYEHGMRRIAESESQLDDGPAWHGLPPERVVRSVIVALVAAFADHERFLRSVVLMSTEQPEIRRRGEMYAARLRGMVARRLAGVCDDDRAVAALFRVAFSTLAFRVAYRSEFFGETVTDDEMVDDLVAVATRLLGVDGLSGRRSGARPGSGRAGSR